MRLARTTTYCLLAATVAFSGCHTGGERCRLFGGRLLEGRFFSNGQNGDAQFVDTQCCDAAPCGNPDCQSCTACEGGDCYGNVAGTPGHLHDGLYAQNYYDSGQAVANSDRGEVANVLPQAQPLPEQPDLEREMSKDDAQPEPVASNQEPVEEPQPEKEPVKPLPVSTTVAPEDVQQEPEGVVLHARPSINHYVLPEYEAIVARENQNQIEASSSARMIQASSRNRVDEFGLPAETIEFRPLPGENHPSLRSDPGEINRDNSADLDVEMIPDPSQTIEPQRATIEPSREYGTIVDEHGTTDDQTASAPLTLRAIPREGDFAGAATFRNVSTGSSAIQPVFSNTGGMSNTLNQSDRVQPPVAPADTTSESSLQILDLPPVPDRPLYNLEAIERMNTLTELPEEQRSVLDLIER